MSELGIGKLITDDKQGRDAIHVAIAPMIANEKLRPGQRVGLVGDGSRAADASKYEPATTKRAIHGVSRSGSGLKPVGIVDPYLTADVETGQKFWIFLFPNTVTSLRHEWTHPDFIDQAAVHRQESVEWLTEFADRVMSMDYSTFIGHLTEFLSSGDSHCLYFDTPDELFSAGSRGLMWTHFERATGIVCADHGDVPFRCAC